MLRFFAKSPYLRFYSIKHAAKKPIKYTDTINLPKTKFPNRLTAAKRVDIERQLVEGAFASAYRYQEAHNVEPTFVLHDGPPYANGDLHMGHAVNKILKDITLRQHAVKGQRVQYIPGWDCHGLPIELKAMAATGGDKAAGQKDALSIRKKSRQFALAAIERQKAEFRAWGVLADWSAADNVYLTFSSNFITNQLQLFLRLHEKGLVYRDLKPVYWSPSSRTALAEAELEYNPNYVSPSVYVRFELTQWPAAVAASEQQVYALVWTTTPWTLPSNQAICYNPALEYALVQLPLSSTNTAESNNLYLLATNLISDFEAATQLKCHIVRTLKGSALQDCRYRHPINRAETALQLFAAQHVLDTKGTGLVHTAPAHGPEDFLVSLQQKLPVQCYVNDEGLYTAEAPDFLRGKSVLECGDKLVLQHIAQDVISVSQLTHAYPIDWRTKQPVIIRASEQWFINTEQLKERAVDEISKVAVYPRVHAEASKNALLTQVQKRPYWCISRQRAWGVPIPVFYERQTGKVITNKQLISHICELVQQEGGIDFWWSKSVSEIVPASLLQQLNLQSSDLVKCWDIFDIWFDSGSTWSQVLQGNQVADLYLEGYDQFTGWFQSSLLTSVAARDCAPYKSLFVHGFTVDEKGHKMSKSLGNVISPKDITQKYGVDVLRWWVAAHGTQHMSITVSDKLLQQAAESVSKVRATLRYLNGVIGAQTQADQVTARQTYLNRYLLSVLVDFEQELQTNYNAYEYNRAVACIQNFVTNQISALYVHSVKDRLYCGDNEELQNIRHTLTQCYKLLCKALWPILPFLVEESWSYYADTAGFHQQHLQAAAAWKDPHVEQVINAALNVKRLLNQQAGDVNSWLLAVQLECADAEQLQLLHALQPEVNTPIADSELCEILQVGSVTLLHAASHKAELAIEWQTLPALLCARCRRYAVTHADCTCARCTNVLRLK